MIKSKETTFFAIIFFVLIDIIFFILSLTSVISFQHFYSIFFASIIAVINLLLAVSSIKKDLTNQKNEIFGQFYKLMAFRVVLMLALIIICLKFLDINRNSFIFSILIFYMFCQIIEIKLLISGKY
ncbi:MAG: ATP synthase subunit I [Ignavibacteriaceae bacterium]